MRSTSPRWATGCSGLRQGETWWSTSDIGWVVGHSYIVYAPLMAGATTIAYEGALDHPDANTVVVDHRARARDRRLHVADRDPAADALRRGDPAAARPRVASSGCSRPARCSTRPPGSGCSKTVFEDRVPVIDHMWQTETAGRSSATRTGSRCCRSSPARPGVALPGIEADVVDPDGEPLGGRGEGRHADQAAVPRPDRDALGRARALRRRLLAQVPGGYYVGDAAHIDEDGYVWFAGRADEIIKIADHRIGTIEVETAFLRHPAVAEAGVTGVPDELRGEVIEAFVALRAGHEPSDELRQELLQTVRRELGPVAVISHVSFVAMLPKTRSGKIMRRVLKAVALDRDPGDISTIEDEGSVDEARRAVEEIRAGILA